MEKCLDFRILFPSPTCPQISEARSLGVKSSIYPSLLSIFDRRSRLRLSRSFPTALTSLHTGVRFRQSRPVHERIGLLKYRLHNMQTGGAKNKDGNPHGDTTRAPNPQSENWTQMLPVAEGTRFFKSIDWSASTLGLPQTWPATLRFAVSLLFSDSRGAAIYWFN